MINNWFFIFVGSILAGILFSCQVVPTKTSNQGEVVAQQKQDSIKVFFKLSPVILDARSPLDFSVSHAPGAIPAQWDEFTKVEPGYRGILQDDDLSLARRLSLWGIDQDTPVLVLGNALQGLGEEARVAWTLKFLGVKNVQFGSWSLVRSTIPRPGMSPENKPIWKPTPQTELLATAEEFKAAVFKFVLLPSKARLKSLQLDSVNAGILKTASVVLDVRDRVGNEPALEKSLVPVKKISWKKFLSPEGLPEISEEDDLKKLGLSHNQTIYVISENGVSSAVATLILRQWGYQAKNFAGGFEFLRRGN